MVSASKSVTEFIDEIPAPSLLRERLSENVRERLLLRRLLKIAEQRAGLKRKPQEASQS